MMRDDPKVKAVDQKINEYLEKVLVKAMGNNQRPVSQEVPADVDMELKLNAKRESCEDATRTLKRGEDEERSKRSRTDGKTREKEGAR